LAAMTCANHPKETTYVRCSRCEKPICVRCMVDSPVGKKCRDCARNRTHIAEAGAKQVLPALLVASLVAVPAGFILLRIGFVFVLPFVYGALVGEAALRAGQRRRSLLMQAVAGVAALIGGLVGLALQIPMSPNDPATISFHWSAALSPYPLIATGLGVVAAVSRVRFL
jgi:hypothetical protein